LSDYQTRLQLKPASDPSPGITALEASGYVRLQVGTAVVILDVGPLGPDYNPGHAHADTLSFELSVGGERILVNSGTSTYEEGALRSLQRSTSAHNTVVVDGADSSEMWGSFRVARRARTHGLLLDDSTGTTLRVACSHDGYRRLPGRVVHHREWQLDERSLSVADRLTGDYQESTARFHLHPRVLPSEDEHGLRDQMHFQTEQTTIDWQGSSPGRTVSSRFFPEFGVVMENHCLVTTFRDQRATNRFAWT